MDSAALSTSKTEKRRPSGLSLNSGKRNISPPLPSPINNNGLVSAPGAEADIDSSAYQQCRPAPPSPHQVEVSLIEWDDEDDTKSRLTRMKKSITDLRAAGRFRSDSTTPMPSPAAAGKQLSEPIKPDIAPQRPDSGRLSQHLTKLNNKPSLKVNRKRGWSNMSSLSDRSTRVGTPLSLASTAALSPRSNSPHFNKKICLGSQHRTSDKGANVNVTRMRDWMTKVFRC
jgi:hypothetical protein